MPRVPPPRPLPDALPAQYQSQIDLLDESSETAQARNRNINTRSISQSLSSLTSSSTSTKSNTSSVFSDDGQEADVGKQSMTPSDTSHMITVPEEPDDPEANALAAAEARKDDDEALPVLDSVGVGPDLDRDIGSVVLYGRPMYLFKAVQNVIGLQESMYEELLDQIARGRDLRPYGWGDEDLVGLDTRGKFEKLMERYTSWVFLLYRSVHHR